jgi:hypothetical protein
MATFVQIVAWFLCWGSLSDLGGVRPVIGLIGEFIFLPWMLTYLSADGLGMSSIMLDVVSGVVQFVFWFALLFVVRLFFYRRDDDPAA